MTEKKQIINLSLQVVPVNTEDSYPIIDRAIALIQKSGVKCQVTPFATVMEGEMDVLLDLVKAVKEECVKAGGEELVLNIQMHIKDGEDVRMEDKTSKFNS